MKTHSNMFYILVQSQSVCRWNSREWQKSRCSHVTDAIIAHTSVLHAATEGADVMLGTALCTSGHCDTHRQWTRLAHIYLGLQRHESPTTPPAPFSQPHTPSLPPISQTELIRHIHLCRYATLNTYLSANTYATLCRSATIIHLCIYIYIYHTVPSLIHPFA